MDFVSVLFLFLLCVVFAFLVAVGYCADFLVRYFRVYDNEDFTEEEEEEVDF